MTVKRFGPYRLEALLGRGGMGEVWRGVDSSHGGRSVAVKVLGAWLGGDEEFGQRFRRRGPGSESRRLGRRNSVARACLVL